MITIRNGAFVSHLVFNGWLKSGWMSVTDRALPMLPNMEHGLDWETFRLPIVTLVPRPLISKSIPKSPPALHASFFQRHLIT